MAVIPICLKFPYHIQTLPVPSKASKQSNKGLPCHSFALQEEFGYSSARFSLKQRTRTVTNASKQTNASTSEMQLRSLESYFAKLQNESDQSSSVSPETSLVLDKGGRTKSQEGLKSLDDYLGKLTEGNNGQFKAKEGLKSLDDYLGKLYREAKPTNYTISSLKNDEITEAAPHFVAGDFKRQEERKMGSLLELKNSQASQLYDKPSDRYLVGILASINIAVFLFEVATPIRNTKFELPSLPLLYGAKINQLILLGEWWRLVTPMFLHSGLLHVGLSCWVLLSFGPRVCRGYGPFTFFLIYLLGGISGNLISFFHTPEPTVGGTGPVFAIIGAWLVYQNQNKDENAKDESSEGLFQKAVIATALTCVLSSLGPIDDWAHLGALCTGIAYGFFTCPMLKLDDASSKTGQKEGITLVRRNADLRNSLIVFTLFIFGLSSLVFFIEPPLNSLVPIGLL